MRKAAIDEVMQLEPDQLLELILADNLAVRRTKRLAFTMSVSCDSAITGGILLLSSDLLAIWRYRHLLSSPYVPGIACPQRYLT